MTTIVVLEDDLRLLDLYADVLSFKGYQIETATSVGELEALLEAHDVALCVCDLRLGLMDGKSTILLLKNLQAQYRTPMILVSAQMMVYEEACREAGFEYLLMKPVRNAVLVELVEKVLGDS